jgi:hypothetical protein
MKTDHTVISITRLPKVNLSLKKREMVLFDKQNVKASKEGMLVGASLAIFLGFTVSGVHLGFPTLSLQAPFC